MACFPKFLNRNCPRRRPTEVRTVSPRFISSAIECINTSHQTVASKSDVVFSEAAVSTGVSYTFKNGAKIINIVSPGTYKISFIGTLYSAVNQEASLSITLNNVVANGSTILQTMVANSYQNVSMEWIIYLTATSLPTAVAIKNSGSGAIAMQCPILSIVKIGQ